MTKPLPVEQFIPQQTIQSYLDALLQEATEDPGLAEQQARAPAPVLVEQRTEAVTEVPVAVAPQIQLPVMPAPLPVVAEPEAKGQPVESLVTQPQWREQAFEALLFDVGGLTLAVPLILLGTIHPLENEITPLFGQPDWFLGIMPTPAGNLKVLDTARWVMPERYTPALRENLRFVISVQGHDWGLAVHGVSKSVKLQPEQIKWRSQDGKRPWLAGTVIEHMCALVDVSSLAGLIAAGEKNQPAGKPARALA